jgi:hypothetical protein
VGCCAGKLPALQGELQRRGGRHEQGDGGGFLGGLKLMVEEKVSFNQVRTQVLAKETSLLAQP